MATLSKAQCRKRLAEGYGKFLKVFIRQPFGINAISLKDMEAIDRIVKKATNRLK